MLAMNNFKIHARAAVKPRGGMLGQMIGRLGELKGVQRDLLTLTAGLGAGLLLDICLFDGSLFQHVATILTGLR